jgi:hypothetical protein
MPQLPTTEPPHTILKDFSVEDLEYLIRLNPNLRGYLQGYLAELKLENHMRGIEGVRDVEKIRDASNIYGDFKVDYKGKEIIVEAKSIASGSVKRFEDDWTGRVRVENVCKRDITVSGLGDIRVSNLVKGQFDILAISCYAVNHDWEFLFMNESDCPERKGYPGLIRTSFVTGTLPEHKTTTRLEDLLKAKLLS